MKDMKGLKFGKVTVLEHHHNVGYTAYWLCQCECGREPFVASRESILSRKNFSCNKCKPPLYKENLIGKKFGRLTVIEYRKGEEKIWGCVCDCGKYTNAKSDALINGNKKSCGCYLTDRRKDKKKKNSVIAFGDISIVYDEEMEYCFLIDTCNVEKIMEYYWSIAKNGYVISRTGGRLKLLHRLLLNTKEDVYIDHINRNPSDNRVCNLRICEDKRGNSLNKSLSGQNKTGVLGVSLVRGGFEANIFVNGKSKRLGRFKTIDEAAKVRKEAEIKYFGEFAPSLVDTKTILEFQSPYL